MKLTLLLSLFILLACQSQKPTPTTIVQSDSDEEAEICIGFDQRQCGIDDFATFLPKDRNSDGMFAGMQLFLSEAGIKVLHMRIDMNFYEIVCNSCDVCPEQHRFFISIPSSEFAKLKNINLMNMASVDCVEHF